MRNILLILSSIFLSSCSSMSDMRAGAPAAEFISSKDADGIANCILSGWQEKSQTYGPVFIQDFEKGKSVYSQSQLELADIKKTGEATTILFYHQGGLFGYRVNSRLGVVKKCI